MTFGRLVSLFFILTVWSVTVSAANPVIKVALDDLPGMDMLNVLTAFERAKARGVEVEVSYMQSEGIAVQSVINGQADIGMGTPYAIIQQSAAPLRMFYQLNKLRFHPVVDNDYASEWKDLDGLAMYTHGEGSGTEAIMNMMAKRHNISYSTMSYIPGSGVRAKALINGRIHASIVDTERRNKLLAMSDRRFSVLPMPEIFASDEAFYANQEFIANNREALLVLVEELISTWRDVNEKPKTAMVDARERFNLLPRLSKDSVAQITPYFSEMVEAGAYPNDGGSDKAFAADAVFYTFSETLKGEASELTESNYWDFSLVREVLAKK